MSVEGISGPLYHKGQWVIVYGYEDGGECVKGKVIKVTYSEILGRYYYEIEYKHGIYTRYITEPEFVVRPYSKELFAECQDRVGESAGIGNHHSYLDWVRDHPLEFSVGLIAAGLVAWGVLRALKSPRPAAA